MTSIDISVYKKQYIELAKNSITIIQDTFKTYVQSKPKNNKLLTEPHRFIHMMRSQSAFLGYEKTAQYCFEIEKIFAKLISNDTFFLNEMQDLDLLQCINQLPRNLDEIELNNTEIDLNKFYNQLQTIYQSI